jgi:alpha-beta hydrolase superfamily lysophospholipase
MSRRSRRLRVAAAAVVAAVLLVLVQPSLGDRLTGLYFKPTRGPVTPPAQVGLVVEETTFDAVDGTPLCAWWFPSTDRQARAVVVVAHGNGANLDRQWKHSFKLAPRGYDVLMFDYRGFGESAGSPSRRHAIEDVGRAIDEAQRRARAEGLPVVVLGQSMGAALSLEACAKRDDVAALMVDCPFDRWRSVAACAVAESRPGRACVGGLLGAALARTGVDPVDAARDLRMPVLIIGGTADAVTRIEGVRAVAAACPRARLLELAGAPHVGSRSAEDDARVLEAEVAFLQEVLR